MRKSSIRILASGAVMAAAAVGLASPALADPTAGPYTATIIDSGTSNKVGSSTYTLDPCGPDCFRVVSRSGVALWDLYRQGPVWVGTGNSDANTATLDNDSLNLTLRPTADPGVVVVAFSLTKI